MAQRIRMQILIEEVEEGVPAPGMGGEIHEAAAGVFEQVISEETAESIDAMAAVLHRMQYEVGRCAMARHLCGVAKKKLAMPPPGTSGC